MRERLRLSLAITLVFSTRVLPAPNLPAAPAGFSWKRIEEVRATFLMPKGWYFKSEASGGTLAYYFTTEKLKKGAPFETGLTINVFKNLKDKDGVAYAQAFVLEVAKKHEALNKWQLDAGALHGFGVVTRQVGKPQEQAHLVSYLAIGNAQTNTLYLLWFESPEPRWEADWKMGEKMLSQFSLDDEF